MTPDRHRLLCALLCSLALPLPAQDPTASGPEAQLSPMYATSAVLTARIRDITRPHNVMPHQLVGIGVVAGLSKTGSSDRGTRQAILNFVRDNNLNLTPAEIGSGNTAIVAITATLPPFAKEGAPIHVQVQSISDAISLHGGSLLRAELRGVDGQIYAAAQGKIWTPGFAVQGERASAQTGLSGVGEVRTGVVVRDLESSFFSESGHLELQVANPSPFNAQSIAEGIRTALADRGHRVLAVDPSLVRIEMPPAARTQANAVEILGAIGEIRVPVENPTKVIVDQGSGTVIAGEGIVISPCVVGVSSITISVIENLQVSQPNEFGSGDTVPYNNTNIEITQQNRELRALALTGGASVAELLDLLRALGLSPPQLVNVFVALGPYLHAELEVR